MYSKNPLQCCCLALSQVDFWDNENHTYTLTGCVLCKWDSLVVFPWNYNYRQNLRIILWHTDVLVTSEWQIKAFSIWRKDKGIVTNRWLLPISQVYKKQMRWRRLSHKGNLKQNGHTRISCESFLPPKR